MVTLPIQLFFYAVFAVWLIWDTIRQQQELADLREQEEQ